VLDGVYQAEGLLSGSFSLDGLLICWLAYIDWEGLGADAG
jgi:hypothetical protein